MSDTQPCLQYGAVRDTACLSCAMDFATAIRCGATVVDEVSIAPAVAATMRCHRFCFTAPTRLPHRLGGKLVDLVAGNGRTLYADCELSQMLRHCGGGCQVDRLANVESTTSYCCHRRGHRAARSSNTQCHSLTESRVRLGTRSHCLELSYTLPSTRERLPNWARPSKLSSAACC